MPGPSFLSTTAIKKFQGKRPQRELWTGGGNLQFLTEITIYLQNGSY